MSVWGRGIMCKAILIATLIGALIAPTAAYASRPATPNEQVAVTEALGKFPYKGYPHGIYLPVVCSVVRISTVNQTWASFHYVVPRGSAGCLKFAADGITLFHFGNHRWHAVTAGSAFRCPIVSYVHQPRVPAAVARDLLHYVRCA
jgi:hypothetical protein